MLTINSTILSYNKINEIEEYKPILPPESIYILQESNNRSFQKFIPDKYDLDKIDFNDIKPRRNSSPVIRNQMQIKNNFFNSMIMNQIEKRDKYIESFPINIYSNDKEKSIININNYKANDILEEEGDIQNTNAYKKEKNKIENNINKNLNNKKIVYSNAKSRNRKENAKKEEIIISKNEISTPNIEKDLLKTPQKKINTINNKNEIKKIEKKKNLEQKSVQSEVITYNYKNIMRRDPNNENTIIINTSFYKRSKHRNGNNKSKNQSLINRNSFNSFLKFEESSKDHGLSNLKLSTLTQNNKKEDIFKQFMNSNSNIFLNKSKLDQSNLNSLINTNSKDNIILNNNKSEQSNLHNSHNNSNLKMDENENEEENENEVISKYEEKNNVKCSNLDNYTFRTGKSNMHNLVNDTKLNHPTYDDKNFFNFTIDKNLTNINLKNSSPPVFNTITSNIIGKGIIKHKPTIGSLESLKKFNFDFPKMRGNDYSKDEDNKSKSFISHKEDNKAENEKKTNMKNYQDIHIKFKNIKKISKNAGFFHILKFLDCYDLMNILQTNKSLIFLVNKAISDAYLKKIKKNLDKYKTDFELLKCSLFYCKVKDALKIDFVLNIRFINKVYNNNRINNDNNEFFIEENLPKCFQIIYCYNYFKQVNPQNILKTKENTKKINMYDYYTYDLYLENDKMPNIYMNKEQSSFNNNTTDKLAFFQPILPFKVNDKGIINLEIYTSNNDFINPSSIKIISKSFNLKKYIADLNSKGYNNLRICEYENICFHWKFITFERTSDIFKEIINKIKTIFQPYFEIINISYENIGFFIFKINLVAVKEGKINNKTEDNLGIKIIIRKKKEIIENEIKKNNLLLERRDIYELRVGETLTLYFTTKIKDNNNKKNQKK